MCVCVCVREKDGVCVVHACVWLCVWMCVWLCVLLWARGMGVSMRAPAAPASRATRGDN